ncbi:MAG TPA: putative porin [Bacteroidota bacterium]|nr:putative porin [Bacteroidota bacterium]
MNRLNRYTHVLIILASLLCAHVSAQTDEARSGAQMQHQIDSSRSTPTVRIPGSPEAAREDSLRRQSPTDTTHSQRAALKPSRDSLVHIVPFNSIGSLSPSHDGYTAIDASGILWHEYRTLTDLVSGRSGIYVSDKGSPGQDNLVSFTGAGRAATGLLVDGVLHNDPFTSTYDFALFPVESIEKLEIVTGTRAFLYGDNLSGGAVNVVTKSFSNNKPYTRIRYSQAPNSYSQTDALFSQNIVSRFNLMFGISFLGFGVDKDPFPGRFNNAEHESFSIRTKLRYNVSQTLNIVLSHLFDHAQTHLNGGVDIITTSEADWFNEGSAKVINLDAYEKRSDHHLSLSTVYRPTGDSTLSATLTLYGSHLLNEYRDEGNIAKPNGVLVRENFESSSGGALARAEWTWGGNSLEASAEARTIKFERSVFAPSGTESRQRVSVKDELSPVSFVTLAGFVKVENGQQQLLENFGADAKIKISTIVTANAGASQSHRHPTRAESYLASGAADTTIAKVLERSNLDPIFTVHPVLEDEIHHVTEAGLHISPTPQFSFGLNASRRMIEHWIDNSLLITRQDRNITFDVITASVLAHSGRFTLDASAEYTHHSEVIRTAPAFTDPTQSNSDIVSYPALLYPQWRGHASVYFHGMLANGNLELKGGVDGRFMSAYDGIQDRFPNGVPNPTLRQRIGNAGLLDLFVIAHLGDAQIHVIWENVTNTNYMLAPYYPMYDSGFKFGVSWEFWD